MSITGGTFVELIDKVVHMGNTSLKVHVEIFVENWMNNCRKKGSSARKLKISKTNNSICRNIAVVPIAFATPINGGLKTAESVLY